MQVTQKCSCRAIVKEYCVCIFTFCAATLYLNVCVLQPKFLKLLQFVH